MKLFFSLLLLTSVSALRAQKLFVTPFVGVKTEIGSSKQPVNSDNTYYEVFTPRIHFGLSPILLGLNFETPVKKNTFGFGFVLGDQANSTVRFEYYVKSDDQYSGYKFRTYKENYAGYNVFKIPLLYKRDLFHLYSKKNPEIKSIGIKFHTGINLEFIKIKNIPVLQNPISYGKEITLLGDTIEAVGYSGHYNRNFSVSFNAGVDFDFYINNKRRINVQFYYEQGTFKIAQSAIGIFYNGNTTISQTNYSATSRGSSIHFKLGFPIGLIHGHK